MVPVGGNIHYLLKAIPEFNGASRRTLYLRRDVGRVESHPCRSLSIPLYDNVFGLLRYIGAIGGFQKDKVNIK